VTRTLRPYGLVLKAGRWYLVAAGTPGRVATYRVSQILDLRPREDHFGRPADFDLAGYWQAYLAEFESRRHRGEAVIRLSPDGRERARHLLEPAASRSIDQTAGPPDTSGWVRAVIPIETPAHAASELLRLGADVEALQPAELRDLMTAIVGRLARTYGAAMHEEQCTAPVGGGASRATLRKSS
jgi:predicted DNA-binding transcriptional regulator YafY